MAGAPMSEQVQQNLKVSDKGAEKSVQKTPDGQARRGDCRKAEPGNIRTSQLHQVVDGLGDANNVMIRDPQHGTRYEMTKEAFLKHWSDRAIFPTK